jgi:hypothetical protein
VHDHDDYTVHDLARDAAYGACVQLHRVRRRVRRLDENLLVLIENPTCDAHDRALDELAARLSPLGIEVVADAAYPDADDVCDLVGLTRAVVLAVPAGCGPSEVREAWREILTACPCGACEDER